MLARLSSVTSVVSAWVDVTGRTFVVELAAPDDRDRVVAEVEQYLGPGSRLLREPWCSAEADPSDDQGDLWLDSGSIRRLSLIEARMLSCNWGKAAAREAALDPNCADHLMMALRRELVDAFDRVHDAGGTTDRRWYVRSFPEACERAISALSGEITQVQASAIRDLLLADAEE